MLKPPQSLRAVIDDSGSGGDSPWFVLAGYLGTVEAWGAFGKPWRAVLDGPPKLEYFKHSEVYGSDNQWAGMSTTERNERIDAFIRVIGKHALRSIYVRLKQQDYDEVIKPYIPSKWQNAYYFLFIGFLSAATMTAKYLGDVEHVEFLGWKSVMIGQWAKPFTQISRLERQKYLLIFIVDVLNPVAKLSQVRCLSVERP